MVSKITATLAILLIIGFINKSLADKDENKNFMQEKNKLQCYIGAETNPKDESQLSSTTTLSDCISPFGTNFCMKITSRVAGNTVVARSCSSLPIYQEKCQTIKLNIGETETCYCNDKDGCNSSSSIHFNIVFLLMSFAIVYFFAYN